MSFFCWVVGGKIVANHLLKGQYSVNRNGCEQCVCHSARMKASEAFNDQKRWPTGKIPIFANHRFDTERF